MACRISIEAKRTATSTKVRDCCVLQIGFWKSGEPMKLASGFRGKDLLAFCWICRWEKYQSEEEVALGRGKRLRKAVSYREAYAAHPTETLSENLDINQGLISIPEGHVGVYWRGSALLKTITYPGFHLNLPLVTHFELVQVTLQTYQITLARDIPCGTKGGVMINFEKIEVKLCDIIL
ncbi:hypothetical protein ACFXTN_018379 [Malus domestica]